MEVASNFQNVAFQLVRSIVDAKIIVPEVRTYVRASDIFYFFHCLDVYLYLYFYLYLYLYLYHSHAPRRVPLLRPCFILHSFFFSYNYFQFSLVLIRPAFYLIQILYSNLSPQVYDLITKLSEQIALSQRRGGEQYMTSCVMLIHIVLCHILSTLILSAVP